LSNLDKLIVSGIWNEDGRSSPDTDSHSTLASLEAFHQHRSLLFSIAYRMLGTVADAEDMVQETFLRWQNVPVAEVQSPRALLVTIISRLCINHLQSARLQREEYFGQWLPEPLVTDSSADPSATLTMDESLSMGFLVLLERLTPIERAVFLLREVFDYKYREIAKITSLSEANCRQILRRARRRITEGRPRFDPSPEKSDELLQRFLGATVNGDMEGLLALLSKDILLYADGGGKTAAVPKPIVGPENVARLILGSMRKFAPEDLVIRSTRINGQPGFVAYSAGRADTVVILNIVAGQIRDIYIVRNPEKLSRAPKLSTEFIC